MAGFPVEVVPVGELVEHPDNPRRHVDEKLVESIRSTGFYGNVVRQRSTGFVVIGNGRAAAARRAGLTELPVQTLDLSDADAKRLMLRDNRLSDLAWYEDEDLASLLADLTVEPGGLAGTEWTVDDLAALTAKSGPGAPGEFPSYDDETIRTDHQCPRCGFEFSGSA